MTNSLGLYGDLDDVELIADVERAFAMEVTDEMASSWYTVGDIHGALIRRFAADGDTKGACATAMAFYRIRRHLPAPANAPKLRTDTPIQCPGKRPAGRMIRRLQNDAGLKMPVCNLTWLGSIGVCVLFLGLAAVLPAHIADMSLLAPLLVFGLGVALCLLDPQALPDDCRTAGQLATKVARLNRGALIGQGAAARLSEIWDDLVEVLSEHSSLPKSEIRADTLLLQSQADRSRAA